MSETEVTAPRLGTAGTSARPAGRREVELPDCGASLLLAKPRIGAVLDFKVDASTSNRQDFESTLDMLVDMTVEPRLDGDDPEMSVEQFRQEMHNLTVGDWTVLSDAVIELSGVKPEAIEAAKAAFQAARGEAVSVPPGEGPGKDGERVTA